MTQNNHTCPQELTKDSIIFMGTPPIAADVLQALLDAGAQVDMVVCQPDKKTGRKQTLTPCAVKELALKHDIPVFQPVRIKEDFQPIVDASPDLIVTCAYGQIVPQAVLDAPRSACVNLHGSILPAYRGSAPIQRAIQDGLQTTGMSLMQMEAGMDTGGVMDVQTIEILPEETSSSLFEKMGKLAGSLIVRNLETLLHGTPEFIPQDSRLASYAKKITREEEHLCLDEEDRQIYNTIRALSSDPGAYVLVNGKKLKLLQASYIPADHEELIPGLFEAKGKKGLYLQLHDGRLDLQKVQMEGKPVMEIKDFMNGQGRSLAGKKAA